MCLQNKALYRNYINVFLGNQEDSISKKTEPANETYPEPGKIKLHNISSLTLPSILIPSVYAPLINVRVYRVAILNRNFS